MEDHAAIDGEVVELVVGRREPRDLRVEQIDQFAEGGDRRMDRHLGADLVAERLRKPDHDAKPRWGGLGHRAGAPETIVVSRSLHSGVGTPSGVRFESS